MNELNHPNLTMAQQVAHAAGEQQLQRTGHAPSAITVVMNKDTLVITMPGALTPAEQAVSADTNGAAKLQEYHRRLFANSIDSLREEIRKITGVDVREAAAEVGSSNGTAIASFASGTMVQVFLLAEHLSDLDWNSPSSPPPNAITPLPVVEVEKSPNGHHGLA